MAEVFCRIGVTEFMKGKMLAVRALGAVVAVPGDALSAIELSPFSDSFDDHVVFAVGIAHGVWKDQVCRLRRAPLLEGAQLLDKNRGQGDGAFLMVLGLESPSGLGRDERYAVREIEITEGHVLYLLITES